MHARHAGDLMIHPSRNDPKASPNDEDYVAYQITRMFNVTRKPHKHTMNSMLVSMYGIASSDSTFCHFKQGPEPITDTPYRKDQSKENDVVQ